MTREQIEFAISQYLDGALSSAERDALEARLRDDGEARALLEEYQRLDDALKGAPPPQVRWERLAEHLSQAVADEEPAPARSVLARIGWTSRLAIAASLLIAVGVTVRIVQLLNQPPIDVTVVEMALDVQGPRAEVAAAAPVVQIEVGPSPGLAAGGRGWRYAEGVVSLPSRVIIASGGGSAQDIRSMPY